MIEHCLHCPVPYIKIKALHIEWDWPWPRNTLLTIRNIRISFRW